MAAESETAPKDAPPLSLFQRILLSTDGTVTDLIALYTGEPIRVHKLEQRLALETAPPLLECNEPAQLLHRRILLTGESKNYLYADSIFVFERFSASIRDRLLNTDRPIGLIWKEERLETYREIVAHSVEPNAEIATHFGLRADEPFVSRTYLIHHRGAPLGAITEKWPLRLFR
jgi:chorismate-pyruvate lyase